MAVEEIYTGFFSSAAIKGYDSVAFFTENKPVKGSRNFEHKWKGATWRFSSQQNLELFKANPEKYAPQYGGWCAYAVSQNTTAGIEPEFFTIVNDKLYLNYDRKVNTKWLANRDNYIVDADKNWPSVLK
jgi:YHS domain-containing protein